MNAIRLRTRQPLVNVNNTIRKQRRQTKPPVTTCYDRRTKKQTESRAVRGNGRRWRLMRSLKCRCIEAMSLFVLCVCCVLSRQNNVDQAMLCYLCECPAFMSVWVRQLVCTAKVNEYKTWNDHCDHEWFLRNIIGLI